MEIGSEISNKIRSAIRAKLMDLGSYVDNELPDYIMVMVANKKTKDQMTDDLSLFLGKNTDRFTYWLDNLLKKLQSISADNEVFEADTKQPDPPPPEAKPKSKESTTQTTPRKTPPGKKDQMSTARRDTSIGRSSDNKRGPSTRGKRMSADDEIQITAGNDDLDDQTKSSAPRETRSSRSLDQLHERSSASMRGPERSVSTTSVSVPRKTASQVTIPERSNITRSLSSRYRQEIPPIGRMAADREESLANRLGPQKGQRQTRARSRQEAPSTSSRKPASSLSSVIGKVDLQLEVEEEAYDPYHPSVGNVASTVKVSERKSAVPPSRQANKSLLMKAVKDATSSLEGAAKKNVGVPEKRQEEAKSQLAKDNSESYRMLRKRPNKSGLQIEVPMGQQIKTTNEPVRASRSRREEILQEFKERIKEEELLEEQRYEEYSPENVQDIRIFQQRSSTDLQYCVDNLEDDEFKGDVEEFVEQERTEEYLPEIEQYTPQRTQTVPENQAALNQRLLIGEYPSLPEPIRPEVDILEADEEEFEDEEIEAGFSDFNPSPQNREYKEPQRPISPRFYVTLDGVDPEKLSQEAAMEIDEDFPNIAMLNSTEQKPHYMNTNTYPDPNPGMRYQDHNPNMNINTYRNPNPGSRYRDPNMTTNTYGDPNPGMRYQDRNLNMNSNTYRDPNMSTNSYRDPNPGMRYRNMSAKDYNSDSDGEVEGENNSSPVKKPKMSLTLTERCRFWPSCKNGASCTFHHPTTLCKLFPKCRFGDKCRFIHPNCKFDASCSNPSCPYTHASHRNPLAMAASMAAQKALSLASPAMLMSSMIPPPPPPAMPPQSPEKVQCRFFPLCKNMNCPFNHPKPCRYGISCTNKASCHFHHPELPSRAKLKWTSGQTNSAASILGDRFILTPDDLLP